MIYTKIVTTDEAREVLAQEVLVDLDLQRKKGLHSFLKLFCLIHLLTTKVNSILSTIEMKSLVIVYLLLVYPQELAIATWMNFSQNMERYIYIYMLYIEIR